MDHTLVKTTADWDRHWLGEALEMAKQANAQGEVPIGAVIVKDNICLAKTHNQPITTCDPSAHAEILALRQAGLTLQNYRLVDCDLYVTLEPCPMCAMAMIHARIRRLIFSATDPRIGAACSIFALLSDKRFNHQISWEQGPYQLEAQQLLQEFFQKRRR